MTWDNDQVCFFDYETSGTRPEHALQPWRMARGEMWATSLVWVWPAAGKLLHGGGLHPSNTTSQAFVEWAAEARPVVCGWNLLFDLSVLLASGVPLELLCRIKWLDGMLLWRHVAIEPEYDARPQDRKHFGLKDYVRQFMPQHAGYEEDVDFHATDPESMRKLHEYNIRDCVRTLEACKALYGQLSERQLQAFLIEADCLPMVAAANLEGMLIDTIGAQDMILKQQKIAADRLALLAPDGMTEKVVRSPKQLAKLMFEDWGLKPLKQTASGANSTDKETLYELAFTDPRAKLIKEYREALGNMKKFAMTPLEAVNYNGDNRSHQLAHVFGTYSGRFTYSSKQKASPKGEIVDDEEEDDA